jgi:hypothetical protein
VAQRLGRRYSKANIEYGCNLGKMPALLSFCHFCHCFLVAILILHPARVFTAAAVVLTASAQVAAGAFLDYRLARRYLPGVTPVARRNARLKLACEENWPLSAISLKDRLPAASSTIAVSSRCWLT